MIYMLVITKHYSSKESRDVTRNREAVEHIFLNLVLKKT